MLGGMWDLSSQPGSNWHTLHWKQSLITRPPGKSFFFFFFSYFGSLIFSSIHKHSTKFKSYRGEYNEKCLYSVSSHPDTPSSLPQRLTCLKDSMAVGIQVAHEACW